MEASDRLREARRARGYESANAAAAAMNVNRFTYAQHESGLNGMRRDTLARYAGFFRVSIDWLLTGRGTMRSGARPVVPVHGTVGAGDRIMPVEDSAGDALPDSIEVPSGDHVGALIVRGDSQWPRFIDGEIVLFDLRAAPPGELVGGYAIVHTMEGERMIKILRRGRGDRWRLESHNAPPLEDVDLLAANAYLGTLPVGRRTLTQPARVGRARRGSGAR
jgi:phage repressor protein C with HTH and peptisase S24 domain